VATQAEEGMMDHVDRLYGRSLLNRMALKAALAALALGVGAGLPSTAIAEPISVAPVALPTFADLIEKVTPAVVSIRVRYGPNQSAAAGTNNGLGPIPPQTGRGGTSIGSGFFVSGDGYVVTNNHVIDNATTYTIVTESGTEYPAKLIGKDDRTDLALLKVEGSQAFPYVKWAEAPPRIGDWVVAIGNPFGLGGTVTFGIVSARGRSLNNGPYDDYIQIDAPINRGNSGGPTFNARGEVIGINTAIYSSSGGSVGIAFDIPASLAQSITAVLKEKGEIVRGWLGVQTQTVTPTIAESVKLTAASGAMVSEPQAGSPAASAGIKAGDVILAVDGKAIKDPRDLALTIGAATPNSTVKVSVWRDGIRQEIMVTLGTIPPPAPPIVPTPRPQGSNNNSGGPQGGTTRTDVPAREGVAIPELGLTIAAAKDRATGVDLFNVSPYGAGFEAGVSEGDVLLAISGKPVTSPDDVRGAINAARQNGEKNLILRIQSGQSFAFLAVPLG
jgi:serine protease Do